MFSNELLDYGGACTKKAAQVRSEPINQTSKFILSPRRRMTNGSNLNGLPLILSQLNQVDRKLEPRGHTPLSCKKLVFKSQLPTYKCVCFQTLEFITCTGHK